MDENLTYNDSGKLLKTDITMLGLTEEEIKERERLLQLQKIRTRWFRQDEFDRLKELSTKMFANVGSPNTIKKLTN